MLPQNPSTEFFLEQLKLKSLKYQCDFIFLSELFHRYYDFLASENEKYNLISAGDLDKVGSRHFADALVGLDLLKRPSKVLDLGSGWGIPGIPLKIVFRDLDLTIVESIQKKSNFIRMAADHLGLENTVVLSDRAEITGQSKEYRETFDFVVTRAMAKFSVAMELVVPHLKLGGQGLFWVGGGEWRNQGDIAKVLSLLGARLVKTIPYSLPGDSAENFRQIVLIEKASSTPSQYPRRVGVPDKKPL